LAEAIARAEAARRRPGARTVDVTLSAEAGTVDLGGKRVRTWIYGGELPGKEIRVRAGDVLRARLDNRLPSDTTIHWHGVALRNDMDGVPEVTQPAVKANTAYTYEFTVPDAGTYWFHPHVGVQLDRGLYVPLIVEDPKEKLSYDQEWVVVLDDWLDGVKGTPDTELATLQKGMDMDHGNMSMSEFKSDALGGDAGDVEYPHYLLNGRLPSAPTTFKTNPGQRVRVRLINAGGDTAFRFAIGDHRLTVVASDGFPVQPIEVDTLLIGMGERYDVLLDVKPGVHPVVAEAEGKKARAFAVLSAGKGAEPPADVQVSQLRGRLLKLDDLIADDSVRLPAGEPRSTLPAALGGDMMSYRWTFNDRRFADTKPLQVRQGERARLRIENKTTMYHPVHLHGHTFQVRREAGDGPRKDTLIVLPKQRLDVDFIADNPGKWLVHCHNIYHAESGMMGIVQYKL
jgi:FtsP/CotA-like multicopper oxidase with cupredoxin domain